MLTNYADVAALVVGLVLPLIVALVTRPSTNPTVKGIAHAVLSLATGVAAIYRTNPQSILWAPAIVAAFLAWLSGTAFYHSLLKKYAWFGWLQNAFVREAKSVLHIKDPAYVDYLEIAETAEQGDVNNFPLSTDVVQKGLEEAVHAAEEIPGVQRAVQAAESLPIVNYAVNAAETVVAPAVQQFEQPTVVLPQATSGQV